MTVDVSGVCTRHPGGESQRENSWTQVRNPVERPESMEGTKLGKEPLVRVSPSDAQTSPESSRGTCSTEAFCPTEGSGAGKWSWARPRQLIPPLIPRKLVQTTKGCSCWPGLILNGLHHGPGTARQELREVASETMPPKGLYCAPHRSLWSSSITRDNGICSPWLLGWLIRTPRTWQSLP